MVSNKLKLVKRKTRIPDEGAYRDDKDRWRIKRKGWKGGVLLFKKDGRQIRKRAQAILRKSYKKIDLPENMLWIPDGGKRYDGFLSKKKSNYINNDGELRDKFECSYDYVDGKLIPIDVTDNNRCKMSKRIPPSNMNGIIDTHFVDVPEKYKGLSGYGILVGRFKQFVKGVVKTYGGCQFRITAEGIYKKIVNDKETVTSHLFVSTDRNVIVTNMKEVHTKLGEAKSKLITNSMELEFTESGWILQRITRLTMDIVSYTPLRAGNHLSLPQELERKGVINPLNKKDDKCAVHCFKIHEFGHLFRANKGRINQYNLYEHKKKINWDGIDFPMPYTQFDIFERNNPQYAVTVLDYWINPKGKGYVRLIRKPNNDAHNEGVEWVDLLMLSDNENRTHYTYVPNLSALLQYQNDSAGHKMYVCRNCLYTTRIKRVMEETHRPLCHPDEPSVQIMPKKDEHICFKHHKRTHFQDVTIWADFETLLKPVEDKNTEKVEGSYTKKYNSQVDCSYCFYVQCKDEQVQKTFEMPYFYVGKKASEHMMKSMRKVVAKIKTIYQKYPKVKNIIWKDGELEQHESATECEHCRKVFNKEDKNAMKCKHHCHKTGKFLGSFCGQCNRDEGKRFRIPCYFHGLRNFDGHLLCESGLKYAQKAPKILAINREKYISQQFDDILFLDSYSFLQKGLATLVERLKSKTGVEELIQRLRKRGHLGNLVSILDKNGGAEHFKHTLGYFKKKVAPKHIHYCLRKGFYPYDYFSNLEQFDEQTCFKKEEFNDRLNDTQITDKDYRYVCQLWKDLGFKTKGDYLRFYNICDVLLLCDVFSTFRSTMYEGFGLDVCNGYFTLPGFAQDCFLKVTGEYYKEKGENFYIEPMTDLNQFLWLEKYAKRGGISAIFNRNLRANNPKMTGYDISVGKQGHKRYISKKQFGQLKKMGEFNKKQKTFSFPKEKLKDFLKLMRLDDVKQENITINFKQGYDPNKKTSYMVLLDINSLYPTKMSDSPLPYGGYRWIDNSNYDSIIKNKKLRCECRYWRTKRSLVNHPFYHNEPPDEKLINDSSASSETAATI